MYTNPEEILIGLLRGWDFSCANAGKEANTKREINRSGLSVFFIKGEVRIISIT
jgi:hypothetical protein